MEYDDFYLHVGWPDEKGHFPVQVVQSPRGETRKPIWQENQLHLPEYQYILDYLYEQIAEPQEVELLGASLHRFLFPTEIYELYCRCREDKGKGLRIRLRIDPEELSLMPWEYCYDPQIRQFLALERQTPMVRYIAESFAWPTTLGMPHPI